MATKLDSTVVSAKTVTLKYKKPANRALSSFSPPSIKTSSRRKLKKALETVIDKRLLEILPAEFEAACGAKDKATLVVLAAKALESLNIREKSNRNDGVYVELIQKTSGGSRGQAWCMYFVQTCIAYAELKTGKASKVYSSGSCASVRVKTPSSVASVSVEDLEPGDVIVWMNTETGLGHTGIFIKMKSSKTMLVIEGNTTAGVVGGKIERDGGGCYATNRDVKGYGDMVVKEILRPF